MSENLNSEINTSKVEIVQLNHGKGLLAKIDIEDGETVYAERSDVFHELTDADFDNPACDACFLVKKIIQDRQTAKFYDEFDLDSSCVNANKPSKPDRVFLKKLSKKSKISYEKVLDIWKIVCAYHVKVALVNSTKNKVRIQMSQLINRTNHSCRPNTKIIHIFSSENDYNSRILTVKAIQHINKGEEIKFSYIDSFLLNFLDFNSRQEQIKSNYGFTCNCERCLEESI